MDGNSSPREFSLEIWIKMIGEIVRLQDGNRAWHDMVKLDKYFWPCSPCLQVRNPAYSLA